MIVDCHTHIWSDPSHLGRGAAGLLRRQGLAEDFQASAAEHLRVTQCVFRSLVWGYRDADGTCVPNEEIARYASSEGARAIGIASIDPCAPDAAAEARELLDRPEFRGLVVSPARQEFHPAHTAALRVYEVAQERKAPVFFDTATHFVPAGRMEFACPMLLDEIAREFPALTIVVSSLGCPWTDECVALLSRHERVFADLAYLLRTPWQAYQALVQAHQHGVMDRLLFASGYPLATPAAAVEALYRLYEIPKGTQLPTIPRETIRAVVERDALAALGIARPGEAPSEEPHDKEPEET